MYRIVHLAVSYFSGLGNDSAKLRRPSAHIRLGIPTSHSTKGISLLPSRLDDMVRSRSVQKAICNGSSFSYSTITSFEGFNTRKTKLGIGLHVHHINYLNFKSDSQLLANLVNRSDWL